MRFPKSLTESYFSKALMSLNEITFLLQLSRIHKGE